MRLTWFIILIQTLIISYILFWPVTIKESENQLSSLESLRSAAGSSSLLAINPSYSESLGQCSLAFGFASLVDIRMRFIDFIKYFPAPAESKYHEELKTKQQMLETLAFSFSNGRGAEFRVPKDLFSELLTIIPNIQSWRTLGGNGATMCKRASHEGCTSYLASPITEDMKTYFIPQKTIFLNKPADTPDLHVILEYREGESWGKYVAHRSNRFYLNHDTQNVDPAVFDSLQYIENVQVLALGGFQLVEGSSQEDDFLSNSFKKVLEIHQKGVKIHFEMGDFHTYTYFSKLQSLVKEADSIGMNEQELGILLCHLKKIKFAGYPSKAPIKKYLSDLSDLIQELRKNEYKASRIHLHTIYSQVICANSVWSYPMKAAARSAILAGQFACNNTDLQNNSFEFYQGKDWKAGETTKCWQDQDMTCCLALNPTCTQVVQVSGLGDNISATGLVYHPLS